MGSARIRLSVAANTALHSAGATGGLRSAAAILHQRPGAVWRLVSYSRQSVAKCTMKPGMKHSSLMQAYRHMLAAILMVALTVMVPANSAAAAPGKTGNDEILVFAASSLAPPLQQIARLYEERNGIKLRFAFASSAALARQIEYGAPADLFITAHPLWLERLAERQRIDMVHVQAIAGNSLVLARPAASAHSTANIRALLLAQDTGRIATGDPGSVPLGMYARSSLQALGLWEAVGPRLAPAANARAALL